MFICQKCRYPLQLNGEAPLEESAVLSFVDEARSSPHLTPEFRTQEQKAVELLSESFVVLPSKPGGTIKTPGSTNLDKQITAMTNIFQIASDKTQVDHPLCTQCSHEVAQELEMRLREAQSEHQVIKETYDAMLQDPLLSDYVDEGEDADESEEKAKEEALLAKLAEIRKQRKDCQEELSKIQKEWATLDEFEDRFWKEFQTFQLELHRYSTDHRALKAKTKNCYNHLER
eukprot:g70932.t1